MDDLRFDWVWRISWKFRNKFGLVIHSSSLCRHLKTFFLGLTVTVQQLKCPDIGVQKASTCTGRRLAQRHQVQRHLASDSWMLWNSYIQRSTDFIQPVQIKAAPRYVAPRLTWTHTKKISHSNKLSWNHTSIGEDW